MEQMLLGGNDSSSGELDAEESKKDPPTQQQRQPTMAPQRATSDPYEPIPASFVQRQPPSASSSAGMEDRQAMEKKQKEEFIVFTRVLVKYLEQKDTGLHMKVKEIIKDCAERNKKKERGFESVTQSMRKRLKEVVLDNYWKRAEAYMLHLVNKQKQHGSDPNRRSGATSSSSMNRQHQQQQRPKSSSSRMLPQEVPSKPMLVPQQQQPPQRTSSSSMHPGSRGIPPQAMLRQPTMAPQRVTSDDPYEPTPVGHRSSQHHRMPVAAPKQQQAAAFVQRQPPSASSSAGMEDRQAMEKKQKEKFIVFTRVLMKYLEQKDTGLHMKVKEIIKDCAERNKKKERGTQSMRKRLKEVVPDNYWKRAEAYMLHLVNKQKQQGSDPNRQSGATSSSSMNRPETMPMQQRGMPTSSTGAVKAQVPTPQQSQQRPQQEGQVLNSTIRDDIKKTQQQG